MESLTFSANEMSALLGINRKTVYEAAEKGQIPGAIRVGRRLLFARGTVLTWLGARSSPEEN